MVGDLPGNIIELYSPEELARLERRVKRHRTALSVLAAAALAVCIALAAHVTTASAPKLELAAIAVSTLAGWVCIYDGIFIVGAGKKELRHAEMLRTEPRVRVEGRAAVTGERFTIRKSVGVRRVAIATEGGIEQALVQENHARLLEDPRVIAVYTAHSYVAAVEVGA